MNNISSKGQRVISLKQVLSDQPDSSLPLSFRISLSMTSAFSNLLTLRMCHRYFELFWKIFYFSLSFQYTLLGSQRLLRPLIHIWLTPSWLFMYTQPISHVAGFFTEVLHYLQNREIIVYGPQGFSAHINELESTSSTFNQDRNDWFKDISVLL